MYSCEGWLHRHHYDVWLQWAAFEAFWEEEEDEVGLDE